PALQSLLVEPGLRARRDQRLDRMHAELDRLLDRPVHAFGGADGLRERDSQRALGIDRYAGAEADRAGLRVGGFGARVEPGSTGAPSTRRSTRTRWCDCRESRT